MPKINETFKKHTHTVQLTDEEKRLLRERVVSYMAYHPLPESVRTLSERSKISGATTPRLESYRIFRFNTTYFTRFAFAGFVFIVAAVPVLAERALPGDMLYPMKVQVTEELRASMTLSPYAKVEWESERLERRLAEARLLAQTGRLTEATERTVVDAVKKHSTTAQETIKELRETDSEEAITVEFAFVSRLQAQSDIFSLSQTSVISEDLEQIVGESVNNPKFLAEALRQAYLQAEATRSEMPIVPEGLLALIERETTYAQELFQSLGNNIEEKEKFALSRRLDDIRRKVETAQAHMLTAAEKSQTIAILNTEIENNTAGQEVDEALRIEMLDGFVGADDGLAQVEESELDALESSDELLIEEETFVEESEDTISNDYSENAVAEEVHFETITLLRSALVDTRKLISFMTLIDVRAMTTLETLVPLTLTNEERAVLVGSELQRAEEMLSELKGLELNGSIEEKVEYAISNIEDDIASVKTLLEQSQLQEAEQLIAQANILLLDVKQLALNANVLPINIASESNKETATSSTATTTESADEEAYSPIEIKDEIDEESEVDSEQVEA